MRPRVSSANEKFVDYLKTVVSDFDEYTQVEKNTFFSVMHSLNVTEHGVGPGSELSIYRNDDDNNLVGFEWPHSEDDDGFPDIYHTEYYISILDLADYVVSKRAVSETDEEAAVKTKPAKYHKPGARKITKGR